MHKTQLEKALYLAAKAFVTSYEMDAQVRTEAKEDPREFSQETYEEAERAAIQSEGRRPGDIPTCPWHGKAAKAGKYGYYCTNKESDPRRANKNGYCNYRFE